jgi:hypothetical protein
MQNSETEYRVTPLHHHSASSPSDTHWFIICHVCTCFIIIPMYPHSFLLLCWESGVVRKVDSSHCPSQEVVSLSTWHSNFTHLLAVSKQILAQLVWNCHFLALDLYHVGFQGKKNRTFWADFLSGTVLSTSCFIQFGGIWANSNVLLTAISWHLQGPQ